MRISEERFIKRQMHCCLIVLFLMALIVGCTPLRNLGKMNWAPRDEMTIEQLCDNWEAYDVFYTGPREAYPLGVIFDIKNDDRKLTGDPWKQIIDKKGLLDQIRWMTVANLQFGLLADPRLWKIFGPDNHLYGYIYTGSSYAYIEKVDEKTLWVGNLDTHFEYDADDSPRRP